MQIPEKLSWQKQSASTTKATLASEQALHLEDIVKIYVQAVRERRREITRVSCANTKNEAALQSTYKQ